MIIIYKNDYNIILSQLNFFSQYNHKLVFPFYFHNELEYCDNILFCNTLQSFDIDDFISLANNKLSLNVLNKLDNISTISLFKILDMGYFNISTEIFQDLFLPFSNILIKKNNQLLYNTDLVINKEFFLDIIDEKKFLKSNYDFKICLK